MAGQLDDPSLARRITTGNLQSAPCQLLLVAPVEAVVAVEALRDLVSAISCGDSSACLKPNDAAAILERAGEACDDRHLRIGIRFRVVRGLQTCHIPKALNNDVLKAAARSEERPV